MWYKIKEGRHRAYPLSLGIHTGKTSESYEVLFDESCRYQLDSENQEDWNKLVGWSYGLHHKDSIRIGWRYYKPLDCIQLVPYFYVNGRRMILENNILNVVIGKKIILDIFCSDSAQGSFSKAEHLYYLSVNTRVLGIDSKWGYNLNLFFGGTKANPNKELKVWIKKLKKH